MEATQRLASFVADAAVEALPDEVVTAAKRAILDTLGVTIAGAREEGSRILLDAIRAGGAGGAGVFGTAIRAPAAQAALANGALGHALDFDDVSVDMRGHPSVPVLSAVLALAETSGSGGSEALTAFVVGFEVECRLGRALGASSYARGWHATSVVGALGAAAACAALRHLDAAQTGHAFGIATSMASGTRQNFGTMTKPLHAGLAARAGVEAAELAACGFSAAPDVLEAPLGFGVLFSPAQDWAPERIGDPGDPWEIVTPGVNVKRYPCCYMTHQALDATLAATCARGRDVSEVESVEVRVPPGSTSALIHRRPTTGLEGKFSMEYCVATALLDGGVRLASFDDDQVRRPAAQELLRRVEVAYLPDPEELPSWATRVTVRLRGGSSLRAETMRARGDPKDPLSWDELAEKYRDCAGRCLPAERVERSLELIAKFPETRVDQLAQTLTLEGGESEAPAR
jgi:2-methylcitrate dehydratase PrpD